jgi:hypothetical protein
VDHVYAFWKEIRRRKISSWDHCGPERIVLYLEKCMKLGVCVFFFLSILHPLGNNLFFIFLALMKYHCSDERTVPSRIFERGLNFFSDEVDYVLRYLSFLVTSIDDENSKPFSISSQLFQY